MKVDLLSLRLLGIGSEKLFSLPRGRKTVIAVALEILFANLFLSRYLFVFSVSNFGGS